MLLRFSWHGKNVQFEFYFLISSTDQPDTVVRRILTAGFCNLQQKSKFSCTPVTSYLYIPVITGLDYKIFLTIYPGHFRLALLDSDTEPQESKLPSSAYNFSVLVSYHLYCNLVLLNVK